MGVGVSRRNSVPVAMSRLFHPCWLVLVLAGCHALEGAPEPPVDSGQVAAAETDSIPPPDGPPTQTTAPPQAEIDAMVAEIDSVRPLASDERTQLIADLRQTDPQFWPLITRVWRAQLKRERSESVALTRSAAAPAASPSQTAEAVPTALASLRDRTANPPAAVPEPVAIPEPATVPNAPLTTQQASASQRVTPPAEETANKDPAGEGVAANSAAPADTAQAAPEGEVRTVSHEEPVEAGWQQSLERAIASLEKEIASDPKAPASRHASLRVLYLLDGRRDDAMKAIPGDSPAANAFWTSQMYGMAVWLDEEKAPSETQRATEARTHIGEAMGHLGELASLEVRNLTFCTRVNSYGGVEPFAKYTFTPEQELLLYAEVENLGFERSAKGCHTKLRSSYQIFDATGRLVDKHDFGTTEETCLNPRRDYYIPYRLWLPSRIYAGEHTLKLTVEDLIANKVGQSEITFAVNESND